MDWKVVTAFSAGAVLASGIVYFAVRPPEAVAPPKPAVQSAPAVQIPAPAPLPEVAAVAPPVRERPIAREKPSPMPPLVRHEKPVVIARNDPPPAPPPPVEPKPVEPSSPPPAPEPAPAPTPAVIPVENVSLPAPETRVPHVVTLAAGTLLAVRVGETISSAHNQVGDTFLATLTKALVIDGLIIADRGARVEGRVVDAAGHLSVTLVRLATDDNQNIRIRTEPYLKDGANSTASDAAKIGAGMAIGAAIGAIAGGGKGAAIGAGAGGAAGVGGVLLTRGRPVEIPVETRLTFRVQDPVTITERLD